MTDDIPPTDADKAREVMVDELKTINKYEEMARQANNPKVAETIEEVAGDEKVHVGNAAALVAMEDPEAVPKMEEGLRETEKDTGVKVSREFKRARPMKGRRKFWDHKIYNLDGWEKSPHDGYWYNKLDPTATEPPMWKYGRNRERAIATLSENDMLARQKAKEKAAAAKDTRTPREKDRDHWYLTLTQSDQFNGTLEDFDKIFDEFKKNILTRPDISMKLLEEGPRTYPKLESFDETLKAEEEAEEKAKKEAERKKAQDEYTKKGEAVKWATVDGTIPPKKSDEKKDEGKGEKEPDKDEALERYEAEFKESKGIDTLILEHQGFRKAKPDNVLIDDQYEQLSDGTIRAKDAIMDDPTGKAAADKEDELEKTLLNIALAESKAQKLRTLDSIEDTAEDLTNMGDRIDIDLIQSLSTVHPNDLTVLEEIFYKKANTKKLNQSVIGLIMNEIKLDKEDNQKILNAATRAEKMRPQVERELIATRAELDSEGDIEPMTKEQKVRNRVPKQYLKEEEAAEAEQSEEDYKRYLVARREARKRQAAKDYETMAALKQRAAEGDPKAAGLLREMQMKDAAFDAMRMHVDPNTGEFDETKVFPYQSNRDKNVYTTPEGIEINPYHYSYTEDAIGDRVKALRSKSTGEEYGLASKSWLQGIMDILEAAEPAKYRFPKDTFFDRVGYRDIRGALASIGITTVGQLRQFIDYYDTLHQEMYAQVKDGKMTWPEANKQLKEAVLNKYMPEMAGNDRRYFMDNFVNDAYGFGGKYVSGSGSSPTMNLYEKIRDLPDDTPIGIGYEHPDFDETEEGRENYADWINMRYTTSSDEALARINPMFLALKNAVAAYTDPNVDVSTVNDATKKALAAVSKYIDDTQPNGDEVHDNAIKNERSIGIKVLRAIEALRDKVIEYDDQSGLATGRGDLTERMYGMFDRVLDSLYGKLAQEIYGAGYYEYNKRTALANGKALLDKYMDDVETLSYFKEGMPPLTQAAIEDIKNELETIDHAFNSRVYGTPEYVEAMNAGVKPQIDVKYLFGDRFQKFARPLIDELDKALIDDGNGSLMFDTETYSGKDYGAKYRMGDLAAELYLMRGKDNSVSAISANAPENKIDPETAAIIEKYGTGMSYNEGVQAFEKLQGIKRKNIPGYFNAENPEDQDTEDPAERAEKDDQYVKRRLDNILGLNLDEIKDGAIALMPHGQIDDVTILNPTDVGVDPQQIYDAIIRKRIPRDMVEAAYQDEGVMNQVRAMADELFDKDERMNDIDRRYLSRGAIPVWMLKDLDEDTLRKAILAVRDDPKVDLAPIVHYMTSNTVKMPEISDEERSQNVANQEKKRVAEEKEKVAEYVREREAIKNDIKNPPKEILDEMSARRQQLMEERAKQEKLDAETVPTEEEKHQQAVDDARLNTSIEAIQLENSMETPESLAEQHKEDEKATQAATDLYNTTHPTAQVNYTPSPTPSNEELQEIADKKNEPIEDRLSDLENRYLTLGEREYYVDEDGKYIFKSASGAPYERRPPLRVERVFSQAIPFYGIKLDLNANEPFDAAKYKMVKKEVQGSTHKKVSRVFRDRQKH